MLPIEGGSTELFNFEPRPSTAQSWNSADYKV